MRPVWLVVAALCAGATGLGLFFGSRPALDEGTVILRYAQIYVEETGGALTDCHGAPGRRDDVWLVILCDGTAGRFAYPVGHDGALVEMTGDEA